MPRRSARKSRSSRRRSRSTVLYLVVLFIFLAVGYGFHLSRIITEKFEGRRWNIPTRVYSEPLSLYPGRPLSRQALLDKLDRLNYRRSAASARDKGDFSIDGDRLLIVLHDFKYPGRHLSGFPLWLDLAGGRVVGMRDARTGELLPEADLEPELISSFFGKTWEARDLIRLEEAPAGLVRGLLVVEDGRFYSHHGVDLIAMARAALTDLARGRIVQGGSTLTQQLVKNFFLTRERTLVRKLNEIWMALILEARYSKREILEAYLNEVYLGQRGPMGIFGFGEAAHFYFGKQVSNLTLGESALLVGLVRSPNNYAPQLHPDRARERRNVVLRLMRDREVISAEAYRRAAAEPIRVREAVGAPNDAPYFMDFIRSQLEENYPGEVLNSEGLKIFTTLDVDMQREAVRAVQGGLDRLERAFPHLQSRGERLEGCLIAVQPQTGYIRAMVGGRDFATTQFNRVTQAKRQPGSLFKPIVYLAALEPGRGGALTPASLVEDRPVSIPIHAGGRSEIWSPRNYDKIYHGRVTVRTALEQSLNAATVQVSQSIGVRRIIETARALGITSPLDPVPSLALGVSEVSPMEMASAYAAVANHGIRAYPLAIRDVVDAQGNVVERRRIRVERAVTPQVAFLVTHLLRGVVDEGTARGIRSLGFTRPAAGKTGTTNDTKDAWFAGFTPNLLALTWVGYDQAQPLGLTGAQAALPIWTDFMKAATAWLPEADFVAPPDIIFRRVSPASGTLCPGGVNEAFIKGTEPKERCRLGEWLR